MSNTDNKTDEQHRQQSRGATQTTKHMNNNDNVLKVLHLKKYKETVNMMTIIVGYIDP